MSYSWFLFVSARKRHHALDILRISGSFVFKEAISPIPKFQGASFCRNISSLGLLHANATGSILPSGWKPPQLFRYWEFPRGFCVVNQKEKLDVGLGSGGDLILNSDHKKQCDFGCEVTVVAKTAKAVCEKKSIDFTKIDINRLPAVLIVGRPNVGKSALYNRLIRRREALVYNTPSDHVTRDIREGVAKLADLRFRVLDSAGLETEATSGSILARTASMTASVLSRVHFAIFLIDVRAGVHPLDMEVGKWLRKHAPGIKPIIALNKCESLCDGVGSISDAVDEARTLGFGDPIAISAETGLGMMVLYDALKPLLEDFALQNLNFLDNCYQDEDDECCSSNEDILSEVDESKSPLQLAIVGRPNVGKSTMLNSLLQEERVLVGPEVGLTRDPVRAHFEYEGRSVYLVDTAGWLQRTGKEKGPSSLSVMQSRKSLLRAHVVALVLDAEEIAKARRSMTHAEVVIARRAVEGGRGLVVIVNKIDLLRGKRALFEKVKEAVPLEIQTVLPQITGIPVVFTSAIEGKGQKAVMRQVIETYEKWCLRLPTSRLNRWLCKVMSRHSWKDQGAQPKIKYFTQVKARPPTFVAFTSGKTQLLDTDIRFLTKSLKDDFGLGGIPLRIMQRSVPRKQGGGSSKSSYFAGRMTGKIFSDKRTTAEC